MAYAATWFELSRDLKDGARVRFQESWDIFPTVLVPAGTTGTVVHNYLNEMHCTLLVRPDSEEIQRKLAEWEGLISLGEHLDPAADVENNATEAATAWHEQSPLEIL